MERPRLLDELAANGVASAVYAKDLEAELALWKDRALPWTSRGKMEARVMDLEAEVQDLRSSIPAMSAAPRSPSEG
jgi:predicted ATPase